MAILVGPCASNDDFYDVLSSWTMKYTACMALIRSSVEGGCVRAGPSLCLALAGETRHEKRTPQLPDLFPTITHTSETANRMGYAETTRLRTWYDIEYNIIQSVQLDAGAICLQG